MINDGFASSPLPGVTGRSDTISRAVTWGPQALQITETGFIAGTIRDAGNSPTTLLRPGLLLGKITASGKFAKFDPTAVDGTQFVAGVLLGDLVPQYAGADQDQFVGSILRSGCVKGCDLLIPGQSSYGLSGQTYEYLVRSQMQHRFLIDDSLHLPPSPYRKIIDCTADRTVAAAETGCLFTNAGAAGAVIFTLPTTAIEGYVYHFFAMVNQTLTITSGTADKLVTFNDAAADSFSFATSGEIIGNGATVVGRADGLWMVIPYNGELVTPTIAT